MVYLTPWMNWSLFAFILVNVLVMVVHIYGIERSDAMLTAVEQYEENAKKGTSSIGGGSSGSGSGGSGTGGDGSGTGGDGSGTGGNTGGSGTGGDGSGTGGNTGGSGTGGGTS